MPKGAHITPEEALRDLARFEVAQRRYERQADLVGGWVTLSSYGGLAVAEWIAYRYMEPALGADVATGLVALTSVFAAVGGLWLGNRAKVWYLFRRAAEEA